jgi:hypothetical protein
LSQTFFFATLVALSATGALAAPGDVGSAGSSSDPGTFIEDRWGVETRDARNLVPQESAPSGLQLGGTVHDLAGRALSGVVVKLFTNGVTAAQALTDVDGSFEIRANPMLGEDLTAELWFQSANPSFLDANVVLAAGRVARERHLFPPCTQKVELLGDATAVTVTMLTLEERTQAILDSDCLERGVSSNR